MSGREPTDKEYEAVAAVARHGSQRAAARALGIDPKSLYQRLKAYQGKVGAPPIPNCAVPPEGFEVFRNSGAYDRHGNLLRQWVGTKKAPTEDIYEPPAGHVIKGESTLVDPDGRTLVRWIKTREGAGEGLVEALREAFTEYEGHAPFVPAPAAADEDLLTVYPLPDLHLGMFAWGRESGDDYDLPIAISLATNSIRTLTDQSRPSKRAVLLGLGDYFHANDEKAVTPHSGHRLDVDSRWQKVYRAGADLAVAMIDIVARKHEEVEVVFLKGNHDPDAAITLTVALSLYYSSVSRITINDGPGIAWYHRFGVNLLGGTHGHTMPNARIASMMPVDRPQDWGCTKYRHFYRGHLHHKAVEETGGVVVETFQTLAARDAYNASSGYRSGRSLSAITYHRDGGEIGRHHVNIWEKSP